VNNPEKRIGCATCGHDQGEHIRWAAYEGTPECLHFDCRNDPYHPFRGQPCGECDKPLSHPDHDGGTIYESTHEFVRNLEGER
jgi:hypothetical protein